MWNGLLGLYVGVNANMHDLKQVIHQWLVVISIRTSIEMSVRACCFVIHEFINPVKWLFFLH